MARVGNDQELLRELIGMFLEDCPGWVEQIQSSVRGADARNLKLFAHLLRRHGFELRRRRRHRGRPPPGAHGHSGELGGAEEAFEALVVAVDELQPALLELSRCPVV